MLIDCSGTGTALGDPYELSAIGQTFGTDRDLPLYVGSVKTNIGHLEGCAGLAGLIKTVLIVENGEIPPLAGFEKANPRFHLDDWRIRLCEERVAWPTEGLRRASVNSFGYGMMPKMTSCFTADFYQVVPMRTSSLRMHTITFSNMELQGIIKPNFTSNTLQN